MDIMSKIQNKEVLLQVLHNYAVNDPCNADLIQVFRLKDYAGSVGRPNCNTLVYKHEANVFMLGEEATQEQLDRNACLPLETIADKLVRQCLQKDLPSCLDNTEYSTREAYKQTKLVAMAHELIPDSAFWVYRECARFHFEHYTPPLFLEQLHSLNLLDKSLWWHFPHISIEEPSMVAYTPSPEYGKADRQVRMKVGRYLQQFYGKMLTQDQIRSMANGVKNLTFHMSKERSAFKAVYEDSSGDRGQTGSCMAGSNIGDVYGDYHPAEVYASGDFAITWLTDHITNELVARAVLAYPDQPNNGGHFVRLYGDEACSLHDMLTAKGYEKRSEYKSGLRLLVLTDDNDNYLMPYIDGCERNVSMMNGSWIIGSCQGEHHHIASSQSGIYEGGAICDHCGDHTDQSEEDMAYSDYHGIRIGECCLDEYTYCYSRHGNMDYIESSNVVYCETDGEYYHDRCLDEHGIVHCEREDAYRSEDECVQSPDGEYMAEGDSVRIELADGDEVFYHHTDTHPIMQMVVALPEDYWGIVRCFMRDDMPEAEATAYAEAQRFVDDYGNERVVGYVSLLDTIRYMRDIKEGVRLLRSMARVPLQPKVNTIITETIQRTYAGQL